jgi:hypothetical protein
MLFGLHSGFRHSQRRDREAPSCGVGFSFHTAVVRLAEADESHNPGPCIHKGEEKRIETEANFFVLGERSSRFREVAGAG